MNKTKTATYLLTLCLCLLLLACGKGEKTIEESQGIIIENKSQTMTEETTEKDVNEENLIPSKEEVLAMRELVLEGMTDEAVERLTENIKVANLQFEEAYLYDNIFEKLSDKDSLVVELL